MKTTLRLKHQILTLIRASNEMIDNTTNNNNNSNNSDNDSNNDSDSVSSNNKNETKNEIESTEMKSIDESSDIIRVKYVKTIATMNR